MKWISLALLSCCILSGCNNQNVEGNIVQKVSENINMKNEYEKPNIIETNSYSDLNLYLGLVDKEDNWLFSPYSIKDCFSMLYTSASGDTKDQFDLILGFKNRGTEFYEKYDAYINSDNSFGVSVANKGFINEDKKSLLNLSALNTDNLELLKMDGETYNYINKYIADNTNDKITDLLSKNSINEDTTLVLVNALHFLKGWNHDKCYIKWSDGIEYKGFSNLTGVYTVKEPTKDIDVLKLSYDSSNRNELGEVVEKDEHDYSMYIICKSKSAKENKVDSYLEGLSSKEFNELLDFNNYKGLKGYDKVCFEVPNFESKYQSSIVPQLKQLGLVAPFKDGTTDFKKLGDIYISDVIHGAYIKTNEDGTEAAAATVITMLETSAARPTKTPKYKEVIVDDTFVFVVKDDTEDNILFMGRIIEPSEKSD